MVGDTAFVRRLAKREPSAKRCTEIPRAQRFAARPPLAQLFAGVTSRAVAAVRDHEYAMKAVADFLGRHYITVSQALAQADRLPSRAKMLEGKT